MIDNISSVLIEEAFDASLKEYFRSVTDPEHFIEGDGYFRAFSGIKNPNHNIFFQDTISKENLEDKLEETIAYFSEKEVPFCWWLSDETFNDQIKKIILSKKLRPYGEIFGLAANLENLEKSFDTPNSLYVDMMKNNDNILEWTRIASNYFGLRNDKTEELDKKVAKYDLSDKSLPFRRFLAFLSGDPVASSTLIISKGVAAIFDDEVIAYYAKYNPFKLSIIYHSLTSAKNMGYNVGIVFADHKRVNYYKTLGFQDKFRYHKFVFVPRKR